MITTLGVVIGSLVVFMIAMQVLVRLKARSMRGRAVPSLGGPLGARLQAASRALVYFFSPSCGACRSITPKMSELHRQHPDSVFVVNVFEDRELAQALQVMATPSLVELTDGTISAYHIGPPTPSLLARYT